ncbi:MAG: hypothetical protein ACRDD7_16650 [Peptostreptococcaceae bacterium]
MSKWKGEGYIYTENYYIEKNYPYIPINLECGFNEYRKADRLDTEGLIGMYDTSDEKDYIRFYCLPKNLDRVGKVLNIRWHGITRDEDGNEHHDWLHDTLCDEFHDLEVEKSKHFEWLWNTDAMRKIRENNIHKVIHFILDNIDKYYGYFINCDQDYEWLYALYDDAKEGYVDDRYKMEVNNGKVC